MGLNWELNMAEQNMINADRLSETFMALVKIDSISREEAFICRMLQEKLVGMGADVSFDDAAAKVDGSSGNLVAKFPGNRLVAPMMLNAHMDTVEPGRGVKPVFKDGAFYSDGTTILGADDKSAVAVLLEVLTVVLENDLPHGPIELVLTVCEEIGLQGAKNLDFSLISAKMGYALDSADTAGIVTRAPSANKLVFEIHGKDTHAGATPEKGINAISLAAKAIAGLELGRIDEETTCNLGIIEGGLATNIVPSLVTVKGEARSHDEAKLKVVTDGIVAAFKKAVNEYHGNGRQADDVNLPRLEYEVIEDFPRTHIPADHPVVQLATQAAENLGRTLKTKTTGGGADANIFFSRDIFTGVLGTGMHDIHSVRENIKLADMMDVGQLVLEIIALHANTALDKEVAQ